MNLVLRLVLALGLALSPIVPGAVASHAHGVHEAHAAAPGSEPTGVSDHCAEQGAAMARLHCCSLAAGHCTQALPRSDGWLLHRTGLAVHRHLPAEVPGRPGPAPEITPPPPRS